jgi:signal transduction histidine kinase
MLEGKGPEFQNFLETVTSEDIEEVRLFKPNGTIVSSSAPSEIGKKIYQEDFDRFLSGSPPEVFTHTRNNRTYYSMVIPIYNRPACHRCHEPGEKYRGILDVEISMNKANKRLAMFRKQMIIFSLLTLITLSICLIILTKYLINKPIDGVVEVMKKAEKGDLNARYITNRQDEIGKLSESLNSMLSELDNARKEIKSLHAEEYQLIEKMASIGEVAAAVAHEIKNPLAGISGALQVLAEDFPDDGSRKEIANEVLSEIERLDMAVKDLLVFSLPPELNLIMTDINAIIDNVIEKIRPPSQKFNVKIHSVSDTIPKTLIDPDQMEKVLLNIAHYSLRSMPGGGTLTFATYNRLQSDEIEVTLSDTGKGISEEDLKDVFKPKFTTRHHGYGSGLGLAISRNIIESHKGRIDVESQVDAGSSFIISLPVKR